MSVRDMFRLFYGDTLCRVLTLTFDLLTLNICNTSSVT